LLGLRSTIHSYFSFFLVLKTLTEGDDCRIYLKFHIICKGISNSADKPSIFYDFFFFGKSDQLHNFYQYFELVSDREKNNTSYERDDLFLIICENELWFNG
jgi:hypothetical protein